jgi:hypothetical protein
MSMRALLMSATRLLAPALDLIKTHFDHDFSDVFARSEILIHRERIVQSDEMPQNRL